MSDSTAAVSAVLAVEPSPVSMRRPPAAVATHRSPNDWRQTWTYSAGFAACSWNRVLVRARRLTSDPSRVVMRWVSVLVATTVYRDAAGAASALPRHSERDRGGNGRHHQGEALRDAQG